MFQNCRFHAFTVLSPSFQQFIVQERNFYALDSQQVRQSNPGLVVFQFPVLECRRRNLLDNLIPADIRLGREAYEANSLIWSHGVIRVEVE